MQQGRSLTPKPLVIQREPGATALSAPRFAPVAEHKVKNMEKTLEKQKF